MAPKKKSKTAASSSQAPPLIWTRRDPLSAFPPSEQPRLYHTKFKDLRNELDRFLLERPVVEQDFENYGLIDAFRQVGWYNILYTNGVPVSSICPEVILEWMATLQRDDGPTPPWSTTLTGFIGHEEVVLSFAKVREVLEIDTLGDYERVTDQAMRFDVTDEETYNRMVSELFIVEGHPGLHKLEASTLKPYVRMLFRLLTFNVIPRAGDKIKVRKYDLRALYALVTGQNPVSFYQLVVMHIWEARERYDRTTIPYTRLIMRILDESRRVPLTARRVGVPTLGFDAKFLKKDKFIFSESPTHWILADNNEDTAGLPKKQKKFPKPGVQPIPEEQPRGNVDQYFEFMNQPFNLATPEGYPSWDPYQQQMFDYNRQGFSYLDSAVRGIAMSQRDLHQDNQAFRSRLDTIEANQARQEEVQTRQEQELRAVMYYQQQFQNQHYDYTEAAAQYHGHPYHLQPPPYHHSQHVGASSSSQPPQEPDFLGMGSLTQSFYETFFFPSGPGGPSSAPGYAQDAQDDDEDSD